MIDKVDMWGQTRTRSTNPTKWSAKAKSSADDIMLIDDEVLDDDGRCPPSQTAKAMHQHVSNITRLPKDAVRAVYQKLGAPMSEWGRHKRET